VIPMSGAPRTESVAIVIADVVDGTQIAVALARRQQPLIENAESPSSSSVQVTG